MTEELKPTLLDREALIERFADMLVQMDGDEIANLYQRLDGRKCECVFDEETQDEAFILSDELVGSTAEITELEWAEDKP